MRWTFKQAFMPHVKKEPEKRKPRHKESIGLNPEIKRGLLVIGLFLIAGILILSYLGIGGQAGSVIDYLLGVAFGESRLLAPILLALIGILIELEQNYPHDVRHFLGFFLLLFGINGIIYLARFHDPTADTFKIVLAGEAGGLMGFGAGYPLSYLFGFWAALVILGALILASLLLLFNTSLARLINTQKMVLTRLGTFGKIIIGVISLFIKKTPDVTDYGAESENFSTPAFEFQTRALKKETNAIPTINASETDEKEKPALEDATPAPKYTRGLPPLDLLSSIRSKPTSGDIKANLFTIQKSLENFGIVVEMGAVQVGPTVTQYTLKPADGIKLSRITALHNDLAMALASHPIRIEAPIPGKSLVGIEVPNQKVALVSLRELLESPEAREQRGNLIIALGKDVAGKPWFADLSALPHLLIAGATGSGKTVCINAVLLSLLLQHTPETLRVILVDPKRVELPNYNGIPHLLTPVITDVQKTVNALRWTIGEMERRFELLSKSCRRDINSYNRVMEQKLPYLIFVIDELADLMTAAGAEVEAGIIRLAQMARAVGIHLILATQRPSVDIITGLIKANMPARLAFSVASLMDSRTILDTSGAEKLLGRGDLLWSPPELSKPKRLQGAFVSEEEIKKVVEFLKGDELPQYNDEITTKQQKTFEFSNAGIPLEDDDPLLDEAKKVILQADKGSASLLQRRLKVGYARAARLLDLLEKIGFIGPADGAKPRELLIKGAGKDIIQEEEIGEENNNAEI